MITEALIPRKSTVDVLDQTALPSQEVWLEARSSVDMDSFIKRLVIRGAPNLGIAGALQISW